MHSYNLLFRFIFYFCFCFIQIFLKTSISHQKPILSIFTPQLLTFIKAFSEIELKAVAQPQTKEVIK